MMAVRKECSATLSGSLMPATHQPLRLTCLSRPASAKNAAAARSFGFFNGLLLGFFLADDLIGKDGGGLRHVERHRGDKHGDGYFYVQVLENDGPDTFFFAADDEPDMQR